MMAAYDELKDTIRIKRVNDELLEHLISSLRWLFHYSDKSHISLPERDKMEDIVSRAMKIAEVKAMTRQLTGPNLV